MCERESVCEGECVGECLCLRESERERECVRDSEGGGTDCEGAVTPARLVVCDQHLEIGPTAAPPNLAHKKTPTPLSPSQDPRHRPTVGS